MYQFWHTLWNDLEKYHHTFNIPPQKWYIKGNLITKIPLNRSLWRCKRRVCSAFRQIWAVLRCANLRRNRSVARWRCEVRGCFRRTSTRRGQLNHHSVDNTKVTDHHAIIPTGESPSRLSADEATVYQMVVTRFVEAFSPNSEEERMLVRFTDGTNWKSHTNLTHPGKYFRPSKVKIMRPTSPK